jgi:hypothetical protein
MNAKTWHDGAVATRRIAFFARHFNQLCER